MACSWEEIMSMFLPFIVLIVLQMGVLIRSKSQPPEPIHIFLSFRGEDTRETFASLLYDALIREGFNVFMDDQSIRSGQDIDMVIKNAIERSLGAAIIFSRDFASSEWCLDELVLVLERKKMLRSTYVLHPIYVDGVQPDEVLNQRGSYQKAFAKHKKWYYWDSNKLKVWRDALREVAGYKGRILKGKWSKFINEIVEEIRQDFCNLGIIVKPRCCPYHSTMHAVYESIKMLLMATIYSTNDKSVVTENGLGISDNWDSKAVLVPIPILILMTLTLILILVLCIILLVILKVKSEKNRSKGQFIPEKFQKMVEPEKAPNEATVPETAVLISTNEASTINARVKKSFVATINRALKANPYRISTISSV